MDADAGDAARDFFRRVQPDDAAGGREFAEVARQFEEDENFLLKAVDFFGYRAYFAGEDYKTSAMAIDNCVVAFLPIQLVVKLMHENNAVSMFFIRHLAKLLGSSDERTVSLTQKHIRGRLAETLLFLKDSYGVEEDGYTLSIYLSREDIASMSNMTTSNAIRTLSSFAMENIIMIDGRKIRIMQDEELRKVSKLG